MTINAGVRYEFFGLPEEVNGRIGNVDLEAVTNTENPVNAFIVPANVNTTGFSAVDASIAASLKADNNHTLKGRTGTTSRRGSGLAWSPGDGKTVVRGGYGIFYDRPSAAFINTVFSNYPFLREQENDPAERGFVQLNLVAAGCELSVRSSTTQTASSASLTGVYQIRDNTEVIRGRRGTLNPVDPATGLPTRGNIAETFEFRAVDRNLHTPYVQQYNFGVQRDLGRNMMLEVRYVGSKGTDLLEALAFNQGYDLNDPQTPGPYFRAVQPGVRRIRQPSGTAECRRDRASSAASASRSGSRTPPSAAPSTTTSRTRPAPSSGSKRARRSLASTSPKRCCSATRDGRSTTLCRSGLVEADVRRPAVQPRLHLLAVEGHELRGPGQHCRRWQARHAEHRVRRCRVTTATSMRTTRCRISTVRTGSAAAGSGSCRSAGCSRDIRFSGFVQMQSGLPYSIYSVEPELGNVVAVR